MRTEAIVTPSVLEWGRKEVALSLDVAADKLGVSGDVLATWEQGAARPTLRQTRLLGKLYGLPFATFYLPSPPASKLRLPHDYRRLALGGTPGVSTALRMDVKWATERREMAFELLQAAAGPPDALTLKASLGDDPESVAVFMRAGLGVSAEEQMSWREPRVAFNAWRDRVEKLGVLVLQTSRLQVSEVRAYSVSAVPLPIIVVNRKDVYAGRSFSLLHELTHLLLHGEGLCNLLENGPDDEEGENQRVEVFCNAVAAACLMPARLFLSQPMVQAGGSGVWSDEVIVELSRVFSVSREAVLRRLLTFGRTSRAFYERKRADYRKEYEHRTARRGFVTPAQNAISTLGRPFVRLVLSRLDAGTITSSDASDYLGLRVKHFQKLAAAVEGEQR